MIEYQEAESEAEKEASRTSQSPEQKLLRSSPLGELGKLCLSAHMPLLSKVSLTRRKQEKDMRLQIQHKCPR